MFYKSEHTSPPMDKSQDEIPEDEVKQESHDKTVTVVQLSDAEFMTQYQVSAYDLRSVNVRSLLTTPVTPEMIEQFRMGNCYFLSALSSLIRRDPNFISKILQITEDGKIAISFYDADDLSKKYVYVIDPTKVVTLTGNRHKHDVIFLLEKAYAIHRLTLEGTQYSETQSAIRAAILKAGGAKAPVEKVLLLLSDKITQKISQEMGEIDKYLALDPAQLALETEITAISVLNELKKCNFEKEVARKKLLDWTIYATNSFYRQDILTVKDKMSHEKKDYSSALMAGQSDVVFRSLTGEHAGKLLIHHDNLAYFLQTFFFEIRNEEPKNCTGQVQATLTRMFGSLDDEQTQLFSQAIKDMSKTRWKEFQLYATDLLKKLERKEPVEVSVELLKIFSKFPNWKVGNSDVVAKCMENIQTYVEENTPQKRGTGRYTPYQKEIYEMIKDHLSRGAYVNIATKSFKQKNKKGLASNHSYEVVNCYKQGNLFFVVLLNPWSRYGREYHRKEKIVHDEKLSVLSASSDWQILPSLKQMFLANMGAQEPPSDLAIPEKLKLAQDGYFAVEITDIVKDFSCLYIGGLNQTPTQRLEW